MPRPGEHPLGDRGQVVLFLLFMLVWVLDSFFFRFSVIITGYIPLYVRLVWTAVIAAAGLILINAGHKVLEKTDAPHLLTTGAFAHVRHPLYLGSMLLFAAVWGSTLSLAALIILVVIFIFYNHIAAYEEKKLEEKFGEAYIPYKKNVPRWGLKLKTPKDFYV
jgi:protein-S-isoprenylcysteine O-methyltransferase Ste14